MRLYNDYNSYLRSKYGCKVYRIGLDAGLTCPNRDGTKGSGGCIYCNEEGSRSSYVNPTDTIAVQLSKRIKYLKDAKDASKFIAYFQAFTNTYAPLDRLKMLYDEILPFEEIVGISIGTRPDTIDQAKMKLISLYKNRYEIWVEYGLQSSHDKTLNAINRGHSFDDFVNAVKLAKEFDIFVSSHIIIGLPGETKNDILETAKRLNELKINGIKIHLLHILKGSILEKLYERGEVKILEQNEYVDLVCDFMENLSGDILIQRLTGEGTRLNHIAPIWALDKLATINKIKKELERRGSYQGIRV